MPSARAGDSRRVFGLPLSDYFEGVSALLLATLGAMVAGLSFSVGSGTLALLSGAVMLVPVATDMRGNIFASLGSRLGTLLHSGELRPRLAREPALVDNLYASFFQTYVLSVVIGVAAGTLSYLIYGEFNMFRLVSISFIAGILSYAPLALAAVTIAVMTYRRGWDPDNFSAPILTLFGDMVTIPFILVSIVLVLSVEGGEPYMVALVLIGLALLLGHSAIAKSRGREYFWRIARESMPVLVLSLTFSLLSGVILEVTFVELIEKAGILIIVPAFLEDGGAIAGMLAARLSTRLHLGELEPSSRPSASVLMEFVRMWILALIAFTSIGVIGYFIASSIQMPVPSLPLMVAVSIIAGELLVTVSNMLTYYVSILSFRRGMDPDNVTIPILTSVVDFAGTALLILTVKSLGII